MRIGIITLSLHFNYGGILQAYALQVALRNLGHEPINIVKKAVSLREKLRTFLYEITPYASFIRQNINTVKDIGFLNYGFIEANDFHALCVGSDQVWRMGGNDINRYFLDILGKKKGKIIKFSYAASFGLDQWPFNDVVTPKIKRALQDFHSVSVRETSGIYLCEKYMGLNAIRVLDPTMIIPIENYIKHISSSPFKTNKKHAFIYFLDSKSEDNLYCCDQILSKMEYELVQGNKNSNVLRKFYFSGGVNDWLAGIYHCEKIVTDSFHGCVFAILFHKDFYVLTNDGGGNSRIETLLRLFNLEDRLIDKKKKFCSRQPINWNKVDEILDIERKASIEFLKLSLSND